MLETCEDALDQIASAVEMSIEFGPRQTIGSGRNHSFGARCFDLGAEIIGVVALVGHHGLTRQTLDQCRGMVDIGDLSGRENETQRNAGGRGP